MRITSKGQVTIPVELRERFGLMPETEVEFVADGKGVRLVPVERADGDSRGKRAVRQLRRHRASRGPAMTTDEILRLTRGE